MWTNPTSVNLYRFFFRKQAQPMQPEYRSDHPDSMCKVEGTVIFCLPGVIEQNFPLANFPAGKSIIQPYFPSERLLYTRSPGEIGLYSAFSALRSDFPLKMNVFLINLYCVHRCMYRVRACVYYLSPGQSTTDIYSHLSPRTIYYIASFPPGQSTIQPPFPQ